MFKNKVCILSLAFLSIFFINILSIAPHLSDYHFGSGSVLPFFTKNNKKYFILSREAAGKPESKGTYDDFGGSREHNWGPQKNEPEPYFMTAAHEFFEEAILEGIGFSLKDTVKFIDINRMNTKYVIAFAKNIGYIVDFQNYAQNLFYSFYVSRQQLKVSYDALKKKVRMAKTDREKEGWKKQIKYYWARIEKDRLAIVECDLLKKTICQHQGSTGIKLQGEVLDPHRLEWNTQEITLRPYFVKKLRPFFMDKPYQEGRNKKIRFYDVNSSPSQVATSPSMKPVCAETSCSTKKINPSAAEPKKAWLTRLWEWIKS